MAGEQPLERGSPASTGRICASCSAMVSAVRLRRAGGGYLCPRCYTELLGATPRKPGPPAGLPPRQAPVKAAAADEPDLLAPTAPDAAPGLYSPEGLGDEALERRRRLSEEVAERAAGEFRREMILATLKLAVYGGLIWLAATAEGAARFALVGFFSADFFVWFVMALVDLPFTGIATLVDVMIYLALIAVLGSGSPALMAMPETNDEIVVVMFVFLSTFFFKGSYHALMKLQEIIED